MGPLFHSSGTKTPCTTLSRSPTPCPKHKLPFVLVKQPINPALYCRAVKTAEKKSLHPKWSYKMKDWIQKPGKHSQQEGGKRRTCVIPQGSAALCRSFYKLQVFDNGMGTWWWQAFSRLVSHFIPMRIGVLLETVVHWDSLLHTKVTPGFEGTFKLSYCDSVAKGGTLDMFRGTFQLDSLLLQKQNCASTRYNKMEILHSKFSAANFDLERSPDYSNICHRWTWGHACN